MMYNLRLYISVILTVYKATFFGYIQPIRISENTNIIIPLDAYLPDLSDPSVVGATLTNPIFAKLYDQINFDIDGKVAAVSVVGCRYYWDLAKCILAQVKIPASCEEQLLFRAPDGRLIRLTERVPDTFIQSRKNTIRVNCMVKRIRLAVMDAYGEPKGEFEAVTLG